MLANWTLQSATNRGVYIMRSSIAIEWSDEVHVTLFRRDKQAKIQIPRPFFFSFIEVGRRQM